jgi:hypothetical protein
MDGLLLLVDFEKAFVFIEWKFLRKALDNLVLLFANGLKHFM